MVGQFYQIEYLDSKKWYLTLSIQYHIKSYFQQKQPTFCWNLFRVAEAFVFAGSHVHVVLQFIACPLVHVALHFVVHVVLHFVAGPLVQLAVLLVHKATCKSFT